MDSENETKIFLEFLDYKIKNNRYNRIMLSQESNVLLNQQITSSQIVLSHININNPNLTLSLIGNHSPKLEYKFVIQLNHQNYIYSFLNVSCSYSINVMSSIHGTNKLEILNYKTYNKMIIFHMNYMKYSIPHNYMTSDISSVILCNINIHNLNFESPNSSFSIESDILKTNFSFKMCFRILLNENKTFLIIHSTKFNNSIPTFSQETKKELLNTMTPIYKEGITLFTSEQNNEDDFFSTLTAYDKKINKLIKKNGVFFKYIYLPIKYMNLEEDDKQIVMIKWFFFLSSDCAQYYKEIKENDKDEFGIVPYKLKCVIKEYMSYCKDVENYTPQDYIEYITAFYYVIVSIISKTIRIYKPILVHINYSSSPKNFYEQAAQLLLKIINKLTDDSALSHCFRQFNSLISTDFNVLNPPLYRENVVEITIIPLKELKEHLINLLPTKIWRIYTDSDSRASFDNFTRIPLINEKKLYKMSKKEIDEKFRNGFNHSCKFALPAMIEILHECFSHGKIWDSNYQNVSPRFLIKEWKMNSYYKNSIPTQESGRILENFIGDSELIHELKNPKQSVKKIFNEHYFIQSNFSELQKEIRKLQSENKTSGSKHQVRERSRNKTMIDNKDEDFEIKNINKIEKNRPILLEGREVIPIIVDNDDEYSNCVRDF